MDELAILKQRKKGEAYIWQVTGIGDFFYLLCVTVTSTEQSIMSNRAYSMAHSMNNCTHVSTCLCITDDPFA